MGEVAIRKLRFVVGCCKLRVAPMRVLKCLRLIVFLSAGICRW